MNKQGIEKAIKEFKINLGLSKEELDLPLPEGEEEHIKEWIMYQELAISALEKQIPKKALNVSNQIDTKHHANQHVGECPSCKNNIVAYAWWKTTHCWVCGQAIDWSVKELQEQLSFYARQRQYVRAGQRAINVRYQKFVALQKISRMKPTLYAR
jgi:transcription elongation factor Elf1